MKMNKYLYSLVSIVILFIASYANAFPEGYIFASGDITQLFTFDSLHKEGMSLWSYSNGLGKYNQAYPYYPYYYLISKLHYLFPSLSSLSVIYMFVFSSLSYFGFRYSLSMWYKGNYIVKELLSLTYVFNIVVLYFYVYTWGYTPFPLIYVFLPIIFTSLIFILRSDSYNNILIKSIPFYVASGISFGNFSWFAVVLFSTGVLWVLWNIIFSRRFFMLARSTKRYILFLFIYIASTLWATYPSLYEILAIADLIYSGGWVFDLKSWIVGQSILFNDAIFLRSGPFFASLPFGFRLLSMSLIATAVVLIIINRTKSEYRAYALMLISFFIVVLIMATKFKGIISSELMVYIFSNPLFVAFKSTDKSMVLMPSILIISIALLLKGYKHKILISSILLALSSISSYPLLLGGIKTNYDLLIPYGESYKSVDRSMLRKIPSEYAEVAHIVNSDTVLGKTIAFPYSVGSSFGWVEYPAWGHVGVDPTSQLFMRGIIQPNENGYFGSDNYGLFFNNNNSPKLLEKLIQLLNVKHIIFHKDVAKHHKKNIKKVIDELVNLGVLSVKYSGDYIVLYEYIKFNSTSISLPSKAILANKVPSMLESLHTYNSDTVYMLTKDNDGNLIKDYFENAQINPMCRKLVDFIDNRDNKIALLSTCDGFMNIVVSDRYISQSKIERVIEIDNGIEKDVTNNVDILHYQANWWMNGWIIKANKGKEYRVNISYSYPILYFLLAPIFMMITLVINRRSKSYLSKL